MKLFVNNNCIGCGMCAQECPEVFSMTASGIAQATKSEIHPDVEDAALQAQMGCPAAAIEEA